MPNHAAPAAEKAWSPLDFDQEAFRAGASEKSFKRFARQGVRTLHAHEGGRGTSDTVRLDQTCC
jgi:phage head maturation protease